MKIVDKDIVRTYMIIKYKKYEIKSSYDNKFGRLF